MITQWATSGFRVFVVPAQCTSVKVTCKGAGGGGLLGGAGGFAEATFAVTPGDSLYCRVGGNGVAGSGSGGGGAGGYPNGGDGGDAVSSNSAGGGGSSSVRFTVDDSAHLKIVAGGGGGRGGNANSTFGNGGAGGANTGAAGTGNGGIGTGGGGGTQVAGGARGNSTVSGLATAGDTAGNGGKGAKVTSAGDAAGGGGGGGYCGGGGGGNGGGLDPNTGSGGGGGSNHIDAAGTAVTNTRGAGSAHGTDGVITLTYNVAPDAPTPSAYDPANVDVTQPVARVWTFSDQDPSDDQSRADVQWRVQGAATWNSITHARDDGQRAYSFVAGLFAAYVDQVIEWQVKTYDLLGAVSPWSASAFFTPRAALTPPVFSPAPVINSNAPTVTANTPDGATTQQFQILTDVAGSPGAVLVQGGIPSPQPAVTSVSAALSYPFVTGTSYHFQVRYQHYTGLWSAWVDSGAIVANINAPLQPSVVVTPLEATASVFLQITNPTGDPHAPVYNDVYRQDLSIAGSPDVRIATGVALNGNYTDWAVGFHHTYRYRVVAISATGAFTSSE